MSMLSKKPTFTFLPQHWPGERGVNHSVHNIFDKRCLAEQARCFYRLLPQKMMLSKKCCRTLSYAPFHMQSGSDGTLVPTLQTLKGSKWPSGASKNCQVENGPKGPKKDPCWASNLRQPAPHFTRRNFLVHQSLGFSINPSLSRY